MVDFTPGEGKSRRRHGREARHVQPAANPRGAMRPRDGGELAFVLSWRTTNIVADVTLVLNLDITSPVVTVFCHDETNDATITVRVTTHADMVRVAVAFDVPYDK